MKQELLDNGGPFFYIDDKGHKRFNMQHTHCFEMKQIEKQLLEMNE